jgi:hypothetical protein
VESVCEALDESHDKAVSMTNERELAGLEIDFGGVV